MILVVDDHHDTAEALRRLLGREGLEVVCAGDAEAAIEILRDSRPQLIILDEMMPGKSGMELLRELREDKHLEGVPILFYSAGWEPAKREEAQRLGAVGWVTKGDFVFDDLRAWIHKLVPHGEA